MKQVTVEQARALVTELGMRSYQECSALTGEGLKDVFDEAVVVGMSGEEVPNKRWFRCAIL